MSTQAPWPAPTPAPPAPARPDAAAIALAIVSWIVQYALVLPVVVLLYLTAKFITGVALALLSRKVAAVTLGALVVGGAAANRFGPPRRESPLMFFMRPWARWPQGVTP